MTQERELVLYYKPTCPFCRKVLDFMNEDGIELPMRDIVADEDARQTLIDVGGKQQVPCLFIDGEPLYESNDIIQYLRDNCA
ncbi:MAG: glutaredoxin [Olsenella sp.]|nr:glutaredoxin [Olsenella sp.]